MSQSMTLFPFETECVCHLGCDLQGVRDGVGAAPCGAQLQENCTVVSHARIDFHTHPVRSIPSWELVVRR